MVKNNQSLMCLLMLPLLFALGACSAFNFGADMAETSLEVRLETARLIGKQAGLAPIEFSSREFNSFGYIDIQDKNAPLMVYLEGDGIAYAANGLATSDPTPLDPVGLRLAALDKSPNRLWLARPCHYSLQATGDDLIAGTLPDDCESRYWTNARYSSSIIDTLEQAINETSIEHGLKDIHLIGYSGGGAVALLLADRLKNIASLRTIAGNLDPVGLGKHRGDFALSGSLDPTDIAVSIQHIPQLHYVGEDDDIIPDWIASSFIDNMNRIDCVKILQIEDADHVKGWTEFWQRAHAHLPAC
ncbi:MAG: hypothetical protein AB8B77_02305 [Alphaproteobacteria bacterium]